MKGYFVPLSGGIDSCATATIVYSMCTLVTKEARLGSKFLKSINPSVSRLVVNGLIIDQQVIDDAIRITGERSDFVPLDAREFCNKIFHTCYMGTENSSPETRKRAKDLATAIGS